MSALKRIPWSRNHKCEHPSRLIFFDTETYGYASDCCPGHIAHKLRLGVVSTWTYKLDRWVKTNSLRFKRCEDFWNCVYDYLRSRRPTWCYSHNINFDLTVLRGWEELDKRNLRIFEQGQTRIKDGDNYAEKTTTWRGKTALDGAPFILEARHNNGPVKFVDTYNYWPVPLSKLGRWLGLPKLELDVFDCDDESMFRYCERDVEIIESAVIKLMDFWSQENLGNWQYTIASLAFSSYRHGKEKCQIVAHGDNDHDPSEPVEFSYSTGIRKLSAKEITDCERRSYYGGRTSVFFAGDVRRNFQSGFNRQTDLYCSGRPTIPGPVTILDVNSMYAYAMIREKHPYEIIDAFPQPNASLCERMIDKFWCTADVEVDSDDYEYPRNCGRFTGYYTGKFCTSLCGDELRSAYQSGVIRTVSNLCVYYSGRPFDRFVEYWNRRKENAAIAGNDIEARFASDMMRSLYGKLAQRTPPWLTCGHIIPPCRWGTFIGKDGPECPAQVMRSIAGISQYRAERKSCRHTFTAAAASITTSARMYMAMMINLCPRQSIVYMDTDSLFCLPPAVETLQRLNFLSQNEIGKLKVKGTYDNVRIWGQKDYEIDGVRVIAGLRSDASEISERVWKQVNMDGVKSVISHDPTGEILSKSVKFAPAGCLQSVTVGLDGWTTPVRLE